MASLLGVLVRLRRIREDAQKGVSTRGIIHRRRLVLKG